MLSLVAAIAMQDSGPADMDFWVGEWTMESRQIGPDGKATRGQAKNSIKKILGGRIIEESFSFNGFEGQSYTAYVPQIKKFRQTWVDNGGTYLTFEGGKVGNQVILEQTLPEPAGRNRMVFDDIRKDSLTWLWQSKAEDGSWKLNWELKYKRVE